MKRIKLLSVALTALFSVNAFASLAGDGGMSGGGGGTLPADPAGELVYQTLNWSRQGLTTYFNRQALYPYSTGRVMDAARNDIQPIMARVGIYAS